VNAAIASIPEREWTPIHHPEAFVDPDTAELVSDAEVAQIGYVAFAGKPKRLHAEGRLVVRRVKRRNQSLGDACGAQGELFDVWPHHAVFTSPFQMLQAEADHRGHAIVEQVIADGKGSALADGTTFLSHGGSRRGALGWLVP